ncbi:MAG: dihydrodipicolinate synthase family protein [Anditalea sp.]
MLNIHYLRENAINYEYSVNYSDYRYLVLKLEKMTKYLNLPKPFKGIIPPMVTPLLDKRTLDKRGLDRLIEHLIEGGVHGLFILGTTGEATSLSYSLRKELIRHTCEKVDGRIPIMVGITDTAPEESLSLATIAAESKASAVVAAPPYYFGMSQAELRDYYIVLADKLPLPLYLYNMPSYTKINIEPTTVKELSEHPRIIGLKDSSANAVYFNSVLYLMKADKSFTLLVGPEEMMASAVLMGGHGGVSGGANMFPKLYVELYNAAVARDFDQIIMLQDKIMEISQKIYWVGQTGSSYLKGLKAALSILGICNDFMASPLSSFEKEEKEIIKDNLSHLT